MIQPFLDFTSIFPIGRGTYANVFSALHKRTLSSVALKIISIDDEEMLFEEKDFYNEIKAQKQIDHPFIAMYYGNYKYEGFRIISMEYARGRTLLDIVNSVEEMKEENIIKIFVQLIAAVDYLHDKKIVHRDIKLENIIVDDANIIKLIDFGMSSVDRGFLSTQCASFPYAAPEIFWGKLIHQVLTFGAVVWYYIACIPKTSLLMGMMYISYHIML